MEHSSSTAFDISSFSDIEGFDGLYKIDKFGNVLSTKNNIILKPKISRGYLTVCLFNNGRRKYKFVHRLVAETYIQNPNGYNVVNHKDENKLNNHVDNLEWCTTEYNINYGTRTKRALETNLKNDHFIKLANQLRESNFYQKRTEKLRKDGTYLRMAKESKSRCGKKVICIETGIIFDSMNDAAKEYGIHQGSISSCCNHKTHTAGGYHFEFIKE